MGRSGIGAPGWLELTGRSGVLMERRQERLNSTRFAKSGAQRAFDVAFGRRYGWKSFAALFPSLTNVWSVPVFPGDHAVRQSCAAGFRSWRTFGPGSSAAHPLDRDHRHQWQDHLDHLVAHLLEAGRSRRADGGNVGRSAAELMIECQIPGAAVPDWLVVEFEQLPDRASPGSWLLKSASDHPHPRPPGTATERSPTTLDKRGLLNRCERPHSTPTIPISWPHAPVGTRRPTWVTAGPAPNSCLCRSHCPESGRRGRSARTPPAFPGPICLQMPGSHNARTADGAAVGLKLALEQRDGGRLPFFPRGPHRLEKIGSSWCQLVQRQQGHQQNDRGGSGPPPPCPVRWCARRWAGQKTGRSQAWLKPSIARPGRRSLMAKPGNGLLPCWPPRFYGGEGHLLGGLSEAVLKPGGLFASGDYRTVLLAPAVPARSIRRLRSRGITSAPLSRHLETLMAMAHDSVDEAARARRLWHRPSAPRSSTLWDRHPQITRARNFMRSMRG